MFQKLIPPLATLVFSSLLVVNLAGCGGNNSNEDVNENSEANTEPSPQQAEPPARLSASTPEEFAQSVLTLLADNDPDKFFEFVFPTKEELLAFVLETIPADKRNDVTQEIEEDYEEQGKQVLESFAQVRNEQAERGCDWKQATLQGAKYDITERSGVSRTDIDITISNNNKTYEFTLDDCILANGRWYTMDNMR